MNEKLKKIKQTLEILEEAVKIRSEKAADIEDIAILFYRLKFAIYSYSNEGNSASCKFRRYVRDGNIMRAVDYTCEELRDRKEEMLKQFRERHQTQEGIYDMAYEAFKEELEDSLSKCRCKSSD